MKERGQDFRFLIFCGKKIAVGGGGKGVGKEGKGKLMLINRGESTAGYL